MRRKEAGFNQPFAKIKARVAKAPRKSGGNLTVHARPTSAMAGESGDDVLFVEAMRGVGEIGGTKRVPIARERAPRIRVDEDAEVEAALADLACGSGEFDLTDTSEFIEGAALGVDPRLLRRLRAGEFAVQATLDLHGLTRDEAREAVARFIDRERAAHRRSVLVIHGRGLHSKDHIPVLKDEIKVWLARGRTGRGVLAFCSARPCDGGVGALYVLLRKPR